MRYTKKLLTGILELFTPGFFKSYKSSEFDLEKFLAENAEEQERRLHEIRDFAKSHGGSGLPADQLEQVMKDTTQSVQINPDTVMTQSVNSEVRAVSKNDIKFSSDMIIKKFDYPAKKQHGKRKKK